ncbi:efflux RND transporter periplasmic adaptor subunit [Thalassotalea sp. G2M2-11]|uniref:efflux RND transporter periplasmic adaptor subunit n=1 Tax=Thalassotalea sp. G2M2-11 TaxID=2787627 RepID=UPI0019D0AB66|nr:efflux RND transporter periplasmic adaptor subunit [Thalassotalea sp. G2M2-11]
MRNLLILLLILTTVACSPEQKVTKKNIRPIAWTSVEQTDLTQLRTLSGIVAPVESTQLSFEVPGKVESVAVNLGDVVKKGQLLATLSQRNFQLTLQSAQAQLAKSNAALSEASSTFKRFSTLIAQKLVSQSEFDNAKANFQAAKSAVNVAQTQVDIAKKNILDSKLLAPYNGKITRRFIEPSQQINTGQPSFEIEGDHGLEVDVLVPETLIQQIVQGDVLSVHFPVLAGLSIPGKINEIGSRAESANAFPVTVVLMQSNNKLRAGMTAEVDFTFAGEGRTGFNGKVSVIPITALRAGLEQKTYVYVFDEQASVVRQRQVQTENILGNRVFISSGLKSGEIIATAGVAFLRDGQRVTLLDKSTARFN